uniref:G_PROTEIN_RECEP_F1_2 domain-containing protein n=1 Tax=Elaeophora elaphi TaxID=1147741 RepID=A0A0R3RJN9_9BILA
MLPSIGSKIIDASEIINSYTKKTFLWTFDWNVWALLSRNQDLINCLLDFKSCISTTAADDFWFSFYEMIDSIAFGDDQIALLCIAMDRKQIDSCGSLMHVTQLQVSLFGLFSNGFSLYIMKSRFRNPFGVLCGSYLKFNLESIVIIFTWCAIVLSVKSPILSSPAVFLLRLLGVLANGAWFGSIFMHFFVALNRYCGIVYPIRYKQLWTESKAITIGIVSWIFGTCLSMVHLYKECSIVFNENQDYRFLYQNSSYGRICASADTILSVGVVTATACIDFITLIKILAHHKSCVLSSLYIGYLTVSRINSYFFTDKWLLFASSTILLILSLSLDGRH